MEFAKACICDRTPFLKGPGILCVRVPNLCLLFVLEFYCKVLTYLKVLFYYIQSALFFIHFFHPLYFLLIFGCFFKSLHVVPLFTESCYFSSTHAKTIFRPGLHLYSKRQKLLITALCIFNLLLTAIKSQNYMFS